MDFKILTLATKEKIVEIKPGRVRLRMSQTQPVTMHLWVTPMEGEMEPPADGPFGELVGEQTLLDNHPDTKAIKSSMSFEVKAGKFYRVALSGSGVANQLDLPAMGAQLELDSPGHKEMLTTAQTEPKAMGFLLHGVLILKCA